ncbi:MAG: outer membrane lipoprotein carrier protein LolA [Acidobacteriota bacterium]
MNTDTRGRGRRLILPVVFLLLFAFEARPAQPAATPTPSAAASLDARALLASIRKAYSSSPSVSCTFVQTYAPSGFAETQPETGRLILQAPDRVRFDYDGPEGKVFTFDGKAGRQYVAADRQLVVRTLKPEERARLPLVFLESTDALLARYTAHAAPANTGLVEITLTPRAGADPKSLTLLATAAGDVKRLILVDASGNRTSFTFTQKLSGPKRPDPDFALAPPAGTKILSE